MYKYLKLLEDKHIQKLEDARGRHCASITHYLSFTLKTNAAKQKKLEYAFRLFISCIEYIKWFLGYMFGPIHAED